MDYFHNIVKNTVCYLTTCLKLWQIYRLDIKKSVIIFKHIFELHTYYFGGPMVTRVGIKVNTQGGGWSSQDSQTDTNFVDGI